MGRLQVYSAPERQRVVIAYLHSKQLLPLRFVRQYLRRRSIIQVRFHHRILLHLNHSCRIYDIYIVLIYPSNK